MRLTPAPSMSPVPLQSMSCVRTRSTPICRCAAVKSGCESSPGSGLPETPWSERMRPVGREASTFTSRSPPAASAGWAVARDAIAQMAASVHRRVFVNVFLLLTRCDGV